MNENEFFEDWHENCPCRIVGTRCSSLPTTNHAGLATCRKEDCPFIFWLSAFNFEKKALGE